MVINDEDSNYYGYLAIITPTLKLHNINKSVLNRKEKKLLRKQPLNLFTQIWPY